MPVVEVTDPHDSRLVDYTDLTDVELRKVREPAEGLFLAEGEKVILRALAAGYHPRSVLCEPKWWPSLEPALGDHDVPVYLAHASVLQHVTG